MCIRDSDGVVLIVLVVILVNAGVGALLQEVDTVAAVAGDGHISRVDVDHVGVGTVIHHSHSHISSLGGDVGDILGAGVSSHIVIVVHHEDGVVVGRCV